MYDTLRMDDNLDFRGLYVEQPARLNNLKALIHKRSRVDGNLCAHAPLRMLQRTLCRYTLELINRQVTQGATAASDDEVAHTLASLTLQALHDCRVLRVDGHDAYATRFSMRHNNIATHNQGLLIGQGYALTRLDSGIGGVQTRVANQGVDNGVAPIVARHIYNSIATRHNLNCGIGKGLLKRGIVSLVANNYPLSAKLSRLGSQLLPAAMCHEAGDAKALGVAAHDVERLHADRAC